VVQTNPASFSREAGIGKQNGMEINVFMTYMYFIVNGAFSMRENTKNGLAMLSRCEKMPKTIGG
jgi:hypothetical protein